MIQLVLTPGRAIWRWLRTVPLFQSHVGHHVEAFIENFLDDQYVRKLRRMRDRPVYTPPQKVTITYEDLDCFQPDPRLALELHHGPNELAGNWQPRNILPSRVIAALENARPDETVIDARLTGDRLDAWSNGPADDPFEGFGDAEGWVRALVAGQVQVAS